MLGVAFHGKGGSGKGFESNIKELTSEIDTITSWRYPDGTSVLDEGCYAWWEPSEMRSFESDVWVGADKAIDVACEAADGASVLLGFSQGAMLIGCLLAEKRMPESVKACVLVGGAWCRPYSNGLGELVQWRLGRKSKTYQSPKLLHIISAQDRVNPPSSAMMLQAAVGGDIVYHTGGHVVPLDKKDAIAAWVRQNAE